jgi:hypothetical protein
VEIPAQVVLMAVPAGRLAPAGIPGRMAVQEAAAAGPAVNQEQTNAHRRRPLVRRWYPNMKPSIKPGYMFDGYKRCSAARIAG